MTRPWLSSISPYTILRVSWSANGLPFTARNTFSHRAKHPSPDTRTMPMAVGFPPVAMAAMTSIQISSLSIT